MSTETVAATDAKAAIAENATHVLAAATTGPMLCRNGMALSAVRTSRSGLQPKAMPCSASAKVAAIVAKREATSIVPIAATAIARIRATASITSATAVASIAATAIVPATGIARVTVNPRVTRLGFAVVYSPKSGKPYWAMALASAPLR